jgi:AraC family transcriptional regulator
MFSPVESAIARMWEGYGEPLSLSDIAKSAILSRFHFCRVFRDATGVSPGRFLSAVRIYQAKRLLVSTSLSVTDISLAVGYNSLGSFTNRFTESVGASPTRFRRMWGEGIRADESPAPAGGSGPSGSGVSPWDAVSPLASTAEQAPGSCSQAGTVTGQIVLPPEYAAARVYLGAFETPIVQRRPTAWTLADIQSASPATYLLTNVPPGEWFIRAVAEADSADPEPWTRRSLLVGGQGSVTVTASAVSEADIELRARRPTDLPILFAVPNLERADLGRPDDTEPCSERQPGPARPALATSAGRAALARRGPYPRRDR